MKWIISVLLSIAFVAPAQAQAPPQSKGIGPCQSTAAKNPGVSVPSEVGVCPLPVAHTSAGPPPDVLEMSASQA
jgi:hypothetical protein